MSPALDDPEDEPAKPSRRRRATVDVVDPHCEHCGAVAHYVATAGHWIHRYGGEACGYIILKPTEGRRVFEPPAPKVRKASIYLVPNQEPEAGGERAPRAQRRLNKSGAAKPKKSRWS